MGFSNVLALEIKGYIKNVMNRDVIMVNEKGKPLSFETSHDSLALPQNYIRQTEIQTVTVDGQSRLFIPLTGQLGTIGGLIIQDKVHEAQTYAPIIKSFAELLVQQYLSLNKPILDATDQLLTKIIFNTNPADLAHYVTEAEILGYNLETSRVAIVVHLHDFWQNCLAADDQLSFEREEIIKNWKRTIEEKLANFFTQTTDNIIAYIGHDTFVIFKSTEGSSEDTIIQLLKKSHRSIFDPLKNSSITKISVGVGHSYRGISGLIDSYREADLALSVGTRMWGENQSYSFDELGILSIIGQGNREKELLFATELLKNLTNRDFIATLESFFDHNLNLTDTADHLGIHRNTVIYRLNQISTQIGLDPRVFDQAIAIKLALLIQKLFGPTR